MSNPLNFLLEYFPTGTAEGDKAILDRVFIYANEFAQVIAPPRNSPNLLVGSKGSGKTAVMAFSKRILDEKNIPNVLLTPFDLDTSSMNGQQSTGDLARTFYGIILDAVISRAAKDSSTLSFGDMITVRDYAIEHGFQNRSFIERARDAISAAASEMVGVDINNAVTHLTQATKEQVIGAISRIVGRKSFYVFIDDTDQVAQPGSLGHLNRVWALLLAVRKLTYDVENLVAVVSLRSEVWNRLQRDDYGQRDQTDHFRSLVVRMKSDRAHVGRVIDRRLALAAASANSPVDGYQQFFDGAGGYAPMSDQKRLWRDLILVRTRDRPRDAIQMINELAKRSISAGLTRISETTFQTTVPPFSRAMAEQLAEEVRPEFPEFLDHFRSLAEANFTEGGFKMTAEGARDHFKRMLPRHGATLNGVRLDQNAPDSPFSVWRFFYQVGVLNARISDTTQVDGYNHVDSDNDPHLVSRSRWNDLQSMLWEVNASYRDYLIEIQKEKSTQSGLPVRPPRKRH